MSNEDILKTIQEETPIGEYEDRVNSSALRVAAAVGIICAIVMVIVELLIVKKCDFGKPFLIALIAGIADVYEWHKTKNKKMIKIRGILSLIFAAFLLMLYIIGLTGVA